MEEKPHAQFRKFSSAAARERGTGAISLLPFPRSDLMTVALWIMWAASVLASFLSACVAVLGPLLGKAIKGMSRVASPQFSGGKALKQRKAESTDSTARAAAAAVTAAAAPATPKKRSLATSPR